jgi:hypothetical protein
MVPPAHNWRNYFRIGTRKSPRSAWFCRGLKDLPILPSCYAIPSRSGCDVWRIRLRNLDPFRTSPKNECAPGRSPEYCLRTVDDDHASTRAGVGQLRMFRRLLPPTVDLVFTFPGPGVGRILLGSGPFNGSVAKNRIVRFATDFHVGPS